MRSSHESTSELDIEIFKSKSKDIPAQAWTDRKGPRCVRLQDFMNNQHMKVVRLSALPTGQLYSPGNIPGTYFC